MKKFYSLTGAAGLLTSVVAYAQLSDVLINVNTTDSSIVTNGGAFPVGAAIVDGICTDDLAGNFNFDFGDGSASTFEPVTIATLQAVFVACNPLGTGSQVQATGAATTTLNLRVKLTGFLLRDVGPNCMTGCITAPLTGNYDPTGAGVLSGATTVDDTQVFMNCDGADQDAFINNFFGVPGPATVTLNTNIGAGSCTPL